MMQVRSRGDTKGETHGDEFVKRRQAKIKGTGTTGHEDRKQESRIKTQVNSPVTCDNRQHRNLNDKISSENDNFINKDHKINRKPLLNSDNELTSHKIQHNHHDGFFYRMFDRTAACDYLPAQVNITI